MEAFAFILLAIGATAQYINTAISEPLGRNTHSGIAFFLWFVLVAAYIIGVETARDNSYQDGLEDGINGNYKIEVTQDTTYTKIEE